MSCTAARTSDLRRLRDLVRVLEGAMALLVEVERAAVGRVLLTADACAAKVRQARDDVSAARLAMAPLVARPSLSDDERRRAVGVLEAAELLLEVRTWLGPRASIRELCAPERPAVH